MARRSDYDRARTAQRRSRAEAAREAAERMQRQQGSVSVKEIARELGVVPSTVYAYLADPDGTQSRARRERLRGSCVSCGAPVTAGASRCLGCDSRERWLRWTEETLVEAMLAWQRAYGELPSSTDWNRTLARRRGGEHSQRLQSARWPPASAVTRVFGSWPAGRTAAAHALQERH